MSDSDGDLAAIPTGLPPPARFANRAAIRMRGAVVCQGAGYFGTPGFTRPGSHFELSSLELIGPRGRPSWELGFGLEGDDLSSLRLVVSDAPDTDDDARSARKGDAGWSATWSGDRRILEVRALLPGGAGGAAIELEGRVEWPAERAPSPVPTSIRALLERHTGVVSRKFSTWDFGREKDPECASVVVESASTAREQLAALRKEVPEGWIAYLGSHRWLDRRDLKGVEVVVAPGRGWADMLRTARLDPVNHALTTESVVRWLAEYERTLGIDVIGASTDSLDFDLRRAPDDVSRFTDDLMALCPDLADSDSSDVEEMVKRGKISLWWD